MYIIAAFCLFSLFSEVKGQIILTPIEQLDTSRVARALVLPGIVEGIDTTLFVNHTPIVILPKRKFKNEKERIKFTRLMYNVKKVYPYAQIINKIYYEVEQQISKMPSEKEQKRYIKTREDELKKQFEQQLVNLTITQGRLLIKLVDRETGATTYNVIREFKGSMSAFLWQSVALMFGSNLKSEYNPNEEDKMIEEIIHMIENGLI